MRQQQKLKVTMSAYQALPIRTSEDISDQEFHRLPFGYKCRNASGMVCELVHSDQMPADQVGLLSNPGRGFLYFTPEFIPEERKVPSNLPKRGFYYHFKHDPNGLVNNYAYEVMMVAEDTEDVNKYSVIYRALYETSSAYKDGLVYARPLEMFVGNVVPDAAPVPRFREITNQSVIAALITIKDRMYPWV